VDAADPALLEEGAVRSDLTLFNPSAEDAVWERVLGYVLVVASLIVSR